MWSTHTLLNLRGKDKDDAVETVTNHIYLNVAVSTIYKKLIGVMILFEKKKNYQLNAKMSRRFQSWRRNSLWKHFPTKLFSHAFFFILLLLLFLYGDCSFP